MATLKDLQFSMNGEPNQAITKVHGKELVGVVKYSEEKPTEVKEKKDWYIFKLVDNSKSGGVYIPNIDDVFNPATKRVERIRLLTGVDTIWLKEQKDLTPDYVKQNMRTIEFPRGVKIRRVSANDHTVLEFMRLSNCNIGNPKRVKAVKQDFEFYEYDFAAAEKEQFAREELEFQMESIARAAKPDVMRKHAAFLGIGMTNDMGEKKTDDGVRREYARYAKSNPSYFKTTMGTELVELSWLVRKALADSLIEVGREPGKIFWANGGGMIGVYSQTDNPQDYLTNLASTNTEEGRLFKDQLKKFGT